MERICRYSTNAHEPWASDSLEVPATATKAVARGTQAVPLCCASLSTAVQDQESDLQNTADNRGGFSLALVVSCHQQHADPVTSTANCYADKQTFQLTRNQPYSIENDLHILSNSIWLTPRLPIGICLMELGVTWRLGSMNGLMHLKALIKTASYRQA
jgi:hypothetical protein